MPFSSYHSSHDKTDALQGALEVLAPAHAIIDANARVIHASHGLRMFFTSPTDPQGKNLFDLLESTAAVKIQSAFGESRQNQVRVSAEEIIFESPMGPMLIFATVSPFAHGAGNSTEPLWILEMAPKAALQDPTTVADSNLWENMPREALVDELQNAKKEWEQTVHKLKFANALLKDSEGQARALVEASCQILWTTNADGQVEEDSPSWREFTGQTFEQRKDSGWLDVIHPDDRRSTLSAWQRSISSGGLYEVEYRLRRADGQWRWTLARAVPQRRLDGSVKRWVGMNADITQRKETEAREHRLKQALRAKERRLRMALRSAGLAAWEWSPEKSIWDEKLYEMLGIDQSTTASTPTFFQSVHPEDLPGLKQAWEDATSGQKSYEHEFRIIRPDGEIRWLAGFGEFTINEQGEVERVYGLNWDITEKKEAEQKENRQRVLDNLVGEVAASIASSLDFETILHDVAEICVPRLADWVRVELFDDEVTNERVVEAVSDPALAPLAEFLTQRVAQLEATDGPISQQPKDPEGIVLKPYHRDALIAATPAEEFQQELRQFGVTPLASVSLVARDTTFGAMTFGVLTASKTFTHDELRVMRELARYAGAAFDNTRLFKAAQAASAAKSQFLANMSHEIRTPMTAILGYADLLAEKENDPTQSEYVEIIKHNGKFLLEIINDILDLSKIEAGKIEIVREPVDPRTLIDEVCSMMQIRAREKELDLNFHVDHDVPEYVECDRIRLRQILINLIGNAVKFTSAGGIDVVVRYQRDMEPPLLSIEVIDSGVGLSPETQRVLFTPFAQGDSAVSKRYGGTGLGLAISQRLAQMLGGDITVSSQLGKGSKFFCTVAARRSNVAETNQDEQRRDSVNGSISAELQTLSCTVLVVDDRRDIHFLTKHFLTKAGAVVQCVEDGLQAIERLTPGASADEEFDLVLLDMHMPRMDGYETATQLRQLGFQKPIIALTADAMEHDRKRCLEVGCNAHLSKPIDAQALIDLIWQFTSNV